MVWLISQFPELDHLEADQRAQVLARVPWWTYPLVTASAIVPAILLSAAIGACVAIGLRSIAAAIIIVPLTATTAIGLYAYQLSRLRTTMRRAIADAFRGERLPFCFECGYNLRDSDAARCPECGGPVHGGADEIKRT
jgi:hypothetical protein